MSQHFLRLPQFPLVLSLFLAACGGDKGGGSVTPAPPAPIVTVTLSDASISTVESATLEWTATNATSCTAAGSWSGARATSGSLVVTSDSPGSLLYLLSCSGPGGISNDSVSLTITAAPGTPSITLMATPALILQGGTATLDWTSTNATACEASGDWTGARGTSGSAAVTPTSSGTMTYKLTCSGPFGSASRSTSVFVSAVPAPALTFTLTPSTINAGEPATLAWTASSASTCTAAGPASWAGTKATSGSLVVTSTVAGSYTYDLVCAGAGGSVGKSLVLTANPPLPPTLSLTLSPPTIIAGQTSTLVWTSTSTSSCTASGPVTWEGIRETSGVLQVTASLPGAYTYALNCTGLGGSASASATLTALPPAIASGYEVSLVAGAPGGAGVLDGSLAAVRLSAPRQVVADLVGNYYWLDQSAHVLRRVSTDGQVATFAGDAYMAGAQDGTGAAARFRLPEGLAVDAANNLYVGDTANHCIRKVTPAAEVTTLAGQCGSPGMSNGMGGAARFDQPSGLVVDADGNLYVVDRGNYAIRKITPAGLVTTHVGQLGIRGAANGAAGVATLDLPGGGIARAPDGTLYFTDRHAVRVVDPAGNVAVLAGAIAEAGSVDSAVSAEGRFRNPQGLALDLAGNVFVADAGNHLVRVIALTGGVDTITGIAGTPGFVNGPLASALLDTPVGVILVGDSIVVSDAGNHALRVATVGSAVSTLAGTPFRKGSVEGSGEAVRFDAPEGLVATAGDSLYVVDAGNAVIRRIVAGATSVFAGRKGEAGVADGAAGTGQLLRPGDLAQRPDGTLVVVDGSALRLVAADGSLATLAGLPAADGYLDDAGTAARFRRPRSIAVNADGDILVADTGNCVIRKVVAGGAVSTVAGSAGDCAVQDGPGGVARFLRPSAITVDTLGNVFVADVGADGGSVVRRLAPSGEVTTLAGQVGNPGRDNGSGVMARFGEIRDLAMLPDGSVLVTDFGTGTLRKVTVGGVVSTVLGGDRQVGERVGDESPLPGAPKGLAVHGATLYWTTDHAVMKAQ